MKMWSQNLLRFINFINMCSFEIWNILFIYQGCKHANGLLFLKRTLQVE